MRREAAAGPGRQVTGRERRQGRRTHGRTQEAGGATLEREPEAVSRIEQHSEQAELQPRQSNSAECEWLRRVDACAGSGESWSLAVAYRCAGTARRENLSPAGRVECAGSCKAGQAAAAAAPPPCRSQLAPLALLRPLASFSVQSVCVLFFRLKPVEDAKKSPSSKHQQPLK